MPARNLTTLRGVIKFYRSLHAHLSVDQMPDVCQYLKDEVKARGKTVPEEPEAPWYSTAAVTSAT